MKWSNIDFKYGFIELLETKSGKSRKIPISDTLRDIFNNLKTENESEYVFINPYTQALCTDIKHRFHTVQDGHREFQVSRFKTHGGREVGRAGIDLVVVKEIPGHSKIETAMRYTHAVPERKLEAINVLECARREAAERNP